MRILELRGTPRQMGQQFGESCREQIALFAELRIQNAIRQAWDYGQKRVVASQVLAAARSCIEPTQHYDPPGFEELTGIAEGSGLGIDQILAMNGLTDIRDILAWPGDLEAFGGCTSFIASSDVTEDGELYCGQTWDLATDNLPFVLGVHRIPRDAPETWCLTTVGCLSLIGLNDAGIAIGTTNIRTFDARPGATYLSIIHKALSQRNFDDARAAIFDAPRAGAHYYYICGPKGEASALECTAMRCEEKRITAGTFVHTNHCLVESHRAIEGLIPNESSEFRRGHMTELIEQTTDNTVQSFIHALSSRKGGELAINRDDINGVNTNGAVIMAPQSGRIWACHGLPDGDAWIEMREPQSS